MRFIGIDLSWKVLPVKPNRTAAVVLNEKCEVITEKLLSTDKDIIEFVKLHKNDGCIMGIDAPLVVPPKIKQRKCERMLLSCKIGVFPGNRDWFFKAFGGVRGEVLVKKLDRQGIPLKDFIEQRQQKNAALEVYPYASWKVLFTNKKVPKYKNTKRKEKIKGLKEIRQKIFDSSMKIKNGKESNIEMDISRMSNRDLDSYGDILDALNAAYTVHVYWRSGEEKCVVLGNKKEGFILTLANDCLRKQAKKGKY